MATMAETDAAPGASTADPAPGAPARGDGAAAVDPMTPVDVESLPANVQNLITSLRQEAGAARNRAKANAAEQARSEVMQQVSQALGLTEPAADPQQLTEQLASTRLAEAEARAELQVTRTALRLGADAERLLDSRAFIEQVNGLSEERFDAELERLIRQRLDADPQMRVGGGSVANGRRPVEALQSGSAPAGGSAPADMDEWMRGRVARR